MLGGYHPPPPQKLENLQNCFLIWLAVKASGFTQEDIFKPGVRLTPFRLYFPHDTPRFCLSGVLVLKYPTIKLFGLAQSLPPKSFDVKNFIQQHDDNGPTLDDIFIIKTMVPGFATIAHPLRTLFKLHISYWRLRVRRFE